MKDDNDKGLLSIGLTSSSEPQNFSTALTLQRLNKELNTTKEAATEASKVRCRVCFKEIAPTPRCFGHGGGGSGGSESGNVSKEYAGSVDDKSLTKSEHLVEANMELMSDFSSLDSSDELDLKSSFDSEIIAGLIDKGLLLVENVRESMTLNIKLLCEPKELSLVQRKELKKFMEAIIKEFNEFKSENKLSDNCLELTHDGQGNILSLRITMPTLALYDTFITRLANNLLAPLSSPKSQKLDEVTRKQDVTPYSMVPNSTIKTQEEIERKDADQAVNKEEEQKPFNPSPFNIKPW